MRHIKTTIIIPASITVAILAIISASIFNFERSADAVTSNNNFRLTATVPSLNVSLGASSANLKLNPSATTASSYTLPVTVTTDNTTGYTLTMSSTSTSLSGANGTIPTLAAKSGGYTDSEFPATRWGYRLGTSGNWFPFETSKQIASSTTAVTNETTNVGLAARADYDTPAGTYAIDISFIAITNPNIRTIADAGEMQLVSSKADGGCPATLATGQVYHLTDNRDNKTYYVARLQDGNCWMLDNLRLDPTSVSLEKLKGNTNASDTALTYLKNGGSSIPSPYTQEAVSKNNYFTDANGYTKAAVITQYAEQTTTDYGNGQHYIGTYYNYCAASAGSYCYAFNAGQTASATYDVCPAGWRMPTGGASGEYQALCNAVKGSACSNGDTAASALAMRAALSTPLSGVYRNGSADFQGSSSYFWSSTYDSGTYMYRLVVASSNVYPQDAFLRYHGVSVRCILK